MDNNPKWASHEGQCPIYFDIQPRETEFQKNVRNLGRAMEHRRLGKIIFFIQQINLLKWVYYYIWGNKKTVYLSIN